MIVATTTTMTMMTTTMMTTTIVTTTIVTTTIVAHSVQPTTNILWLPVMTCSERIPTDTDIHTHTHTPIVGKRWFDQKGIGRTCTEGGGIITGCIGSMCGVPDHAAGCYVDVTGSGCGVVCVIVVVDVYAVVVVLVVVVVVVAVIATAGTTVVVAGFVWVYSAAGVTGYVLIFEDGLSVPHCNCVTVTVLCFSLLLD